MRDRRYFSVEDFACALCFEAKDVEQQPYPEEKKIT
jgi:hypothetical protein